MVPLAAAIYASIGVLTLAAGVALLLPGALESSVEWRWWAAGISLVGAVFSVSVAIQQTAGPTTANLIADRISFAAVLMLLVLLLGLTQSYWNIQMPRFLAAIATLHGVLALGTVFTDVVIAPEFEARQALPLFGGEYWEASVGPVQSWLTVYLVLGAVASIVLWFRSRKADRDGSAAFVVGFGAWLLLGVNDAVSNIFASSAPPSLALGFLIFMILLTVMAFRESRELRRRLQESQAQATAVLRASPNPIFALRGDGRILFANKGFERITGGSPGTDGERFLALLRPTDRERLERAAHRARTTGNHQALDVELASRSDVVRQYSCAISPFDEISDHNSAIVIALTDVTARAREAERSRYLAFHDPLTGLMNRAALNQRLQELVDQSRRHPESPEWAVLFVDLDKFKAINDTLGHSYGDKVLVEAAHRIADVAPRSDLCFRLGGDEFVLIVTGLEDGLDALRVATQIVDTLQESVHIDGSVVSLRASVGVTIHPSNGLSVADVLRKADLAMYEAKDGPDPVRFFTEELNDRAMQQMHLEMDLNRALQNREFSLHYQRIVDVSGQTRELEALIRWTHPKRGNVPPGEFIEIAERSGLIVPIGEWVMHQVFRDQRRVSERYPRAGVAINVSMIQLRRPTFASEVAMILDETGASPEAITIEITETVLARDLALVTERVHELRTLGFSIAIDDFGTGYSSLAYLSSLPIDIVKFDRQLLLQEFAEDGAGHVLRGLLAIVRDLKLRTVIEGVETAEQATRVRATGDVWLQGFHIQRPQPLAQHLEEPQ